jgi:hypothetical protein
MEQFGLKIKQGKGPVHKVTGECGQQQDNHIDNQEILYNRG